MEDTLISINIEQKLVECPNPLAQPLFEMMPLAVWNDSWKQVKGKNPFGLLLIPVNGEGDALAQEGLISLPPLPIEII